MAELRASRAEARAKAQAVERFGARRSLTGEPLAPNLPATAEGFATGAISSQHATAIAAVVEAIPAPARAEHATQVETTLLDFAVTSDSRTVRLLGQRILAHLDPDGPAPQEQRQSNRRLGLSRNPDSTGLLDGLLTPACLAIWETILTPLAARRSSDALGDDNRNPGQRLHDAFEEAGRQLLASGRLPDQAGLPSQLIITASLTDLERRAGRATTHHGGTISVQDALRLAADGGMLPAVLDDAGGILGLWSQPPTCLAGSAQGPLRPRPRLHLSRLRSPRGPIRDPPCDRLGEWRPYRPGQHGDGLWLPQHRGTQMWMANPLDRRCPALAATRVAPDTATTTQLSASSRTPPDGEART